MLEFKNVSKSFLDGAEETAVLKNINLKVEEGEFLVLLGFSGTGKTTLMNLMAGLEMPSKGRLLSKASLSQAPAQSAG